MTNETIEKLVNYKMITMQGSRKWVTKSQKKQSPPIINKQCPYCKRKKSLDLFGIENDGIIDILSLCITCLESLDKSTQEDYILKNLIWGRWYYIDNISIISQHDPTQLVIESKEEKLKNEQLRIEKRE